MVARPWSSSRLSCGDRLPEAIVRNPAREKVMRKEADIRKACSTSGAPLEIPKHVPQQKSAGFCALPFHSSDIFWKKSIQGFSLLHLKECFNPKNPSDGFLACLQDSASVFV